MTQKFCHECGSKLLADSKFCNKCGTSLASLAEKPKQPQAIRPTHQQATVVSVDNDKDGDGDSYIDTMANFTPQLDALDIEIQKPRNNNIDNIEALAKNQFVNVSTEQRTPPPTLSPEEALKQFAQEAGAIRPK